MWRPLAGCGVRPLYNLPTFPERRACQIISFPSSLNPSTLPISVVLDSKHPKYKEILARMIDGSAKIEVVSQYYNISDEFSQAVTAGRAEDKKD